MTTNNNGHLVDDKGNVVVDFVWGNVPMQPNDDRPTGSRLNFALDNHVIAETAWNGYPLYTPNTDGAYDGGVSYATVPNLVGLTVAAATDALLDAGLVLGTSTTTATGATAQNTGKVKTQSVAAGASDIALGTAVNIVSYLYTP